MQMMHSASEIFQVLLKRLNQEVSIERLRVYGQQFEQREKSLVEKISTKSRKLRLDE